MANFYILTDSSCDLPKDLIEKNSIDYLGLICNFNNKDYIEDCGTSLSYSDFYEEIRKGTMPTTSQINSFRFSETFLEYAKSEKPLLYVSFSSSLSGTYNSALIAKEETLEQYPNAKIEIIDSKSASLGVGLLVMESCKLRDSGYTLDDAVKYLNDFKYKINHIFTVDDLNHLKRGGRISSAAATFGSLLNIKPILRVSNEGSLVSYSKVKGRKKSIKTLFEEIKNRIVDPQNQTIYISHADCMEDALKLSDMIKEEFSIPVVINYIGLAIGSHTGANALAIFCTGNNREED
ncbi:DegV family protein [Clostridium sp. LY3-2]|uniref:DegV family protein n=1 Tax=Clostridium sp. LY3-2 TaxID=2942482 RepID=UPI002152ACEC|nr:DegV family protein [Clostridium sp. LY3-2]MCR6514891.1 DegV family protein [Clostridium sp. LY3-2]